MPQNSKSLDLNGSKKMKKIQMAGCRDQLDNAKYQFTGRSRLKTHQLAADAPIVTDCFRSPLLRIFALILTLPTSVWARGRLVQLGSIQSTDSPLVFEYRTSASARQKLEGNGTRQATLRSGEILALETESQTGKFKVYQDATGAGFYRVEANSGAFFVDRQFIDQRASSAPKEFQPIASEQALTLNPEDCPTEDCFQNLGANPEGQVIGSQLFWSGKTNPLKLTNYLLVVPKGAKSTDPAVWVRADQMADAVPEVVENESTEDAVADLINANCTNRNPVPFLDLAALVSKFKSEEGQFLDALMRKIGHCATYAKDGKSYVELLEMSYLFKDLDILGHTVTSKELRAIDLMSRSLYAEMASCNRNGPHYMNAVAKVLRNRMRYISTDITSEADKTEFNSNKLFPESRIAGGDVGDVILRPFAVSSWNKGDPATKMAICPANPLAAGKNPIALNPAQRAYRQAVKTAFRAILMPEEFDQENANIKALFYTSEIKMGEGFNEIKQPHPKGKSYESRCLRFWESKQIRSKKHGKNWS